MATKTRVPDFAAEKRNYISEKKLILSFKGFLHARLNVLAWSYSIRLTFNNV